jgi:hypothetical protein
MYIIRNESLNMANRNNFNTVKGKNLAVFSYYPYSHPATQLIMKLKETVSQYGYVFENFKNKCGYVFENFKNKVSIYFCSYTDGFQDL